MAKSLIRTKLGELKISLYNANKGVNALLYGTQLISDHLRWLRKKEVSRKSEFIDNGYLSYNLLDYNSWQKLSDDVQSYYKDFGTIKESKVDWALNKRVYLDLEKNNNIKTIIDNLCDSNNFKNKINEIVGSNNWEIYSIQIWRNYPEEFNNKEKEINSSFYHVDNGGDKENRLLINIFMYLSPITKLNGPFTFYDKISSIKINKKFFTFIMKYGNLRKYFLTEKIENFLPPNLLLDSGGKALIINNQECLHRAGFCSQGHRDIIEIIIKQNN